MDEYESILDRRIKRYNTALDLASQINFTITSEGMMPASVLNAIDALQAALYWELTKLNKDKGVKNG